MEKKIRYYSDIPPHTPDADEFINKYYSDVVDPNNFFVTRKILCEMVAAQFYVDIETASKWITDTTT
jgi:hypothetical protein